MLAMVFGERMVTAGELNPALAIPPGEITGVVCEMAVIENGALSPPADATTLKVPGAEPSVREVLAVPSGKCKNGDCKVLWSHPFSPSFFGTVALTPDRVFAVSFTTAIDPVQVVQALALGTGRVIWQGSAAFF